MLTVLLLLLLITTEDELLRSKDHHEVGLQANLQDVAYKDACCTQRDGCRCRKPIELTLAPRYQLQHLGVAHAEQQKQHQEEVRAAAHEASPINKFAPAIEKEECCHSIERQRRCNRTRSEERNTAHQLRVFGLQHCVGLKRI